MDPQGSDLYMLFLLSSKAMPRVCKAISLTHLTSYRESAVGVHHIFSCLPQKQREMITSPPKQNWQCLPNTVNCSHLIQIP